MANALPSTGFHPDTALLAQQKYLTPQNKMLVPHCGYMIGKPLMNDQLSGVTEGSSQMNIWPPAQMHEPCWSTWWSLNRLRVQKGRCRAMVNIWKLSHTDVCDCGERQTMPNRMTCGDALDCTWTSLGIPTLSVSTVPITGRNHSTSNYRGLVLSCWYSVEPPLVGC